MTDVVRDTNPDLDAIEKRARWEIGYRSAVRVATRDANEAAHFASDVLDLIAVVRSERAGREKAEALIAELTEIRAMSCFEWLEKARAVLAGEGDAE